MGEERLKPSPGLEKPGMNAAAQTISAFTPRLLRDQATVAASADAAQPVDAANIDKTLPGQRKYSELDLFRLYKEGRIFRCSRGYLASERMIDPITGRARYGENYVIEDSFSYLELLMTRLQEEAGRLEAGPAGPDALKRLIAIDYELSICLDMYKGIHPIAAEEFFLSPRQIRDALEDAFAPGALWAYLMEGGQGALGYLRMMQQTLQSADPSLLYDLSE